MIPRKWSRIIAVKSNTLGNILQLLGRRKKFTMVLRTYDEVITKRIGKTYRKDH
jgi:hypothetical protein